MPENTRTSEEERVGHGLGLGSVGRTPGTALSPAIHLPHLWGKTVPGGQIPARRCRSRVRQVEEPFLPKMRQALAVADQCPGCRGKSSLSPGPGCRHLRRVLRAAIHSFKYQKNTSLLPYLQQLLQDCLEKHPLPEVDLVIPVPCTGARNGSGALTRRPFWPGGGPPFAKPVDYHSPGAEIPHAPTSGLSRRERENSSEPLPRPPPAEQKPSSGR